ncbi:MAG: hypothetical protein QM770_21125 [Tepidisphaeraceae bacterium]
MESLDRRVQLSAGAIDNLFKPALFSFPNGYESADAVDVDAWGRVVLAGRWNERLKNHNTGASAVGLARYRADGSLDTSFGYDGFTLKTAGMESLAGLRRLDGGGFLLVGQRVGSGSATHNDILIVRLTPKGKLDSTFGGGDGVVSLDLPGDQETVYSVSNLTSDGKLYLGGMVRTTQLTGIVARVNADGSLDTSFGSGGYFQSRFGLTDVSNDLFSTTYQPAVTAIHADDGGTIRLGVSGTYTGFNESSPSEASGVSPVLARLTSAGVLDSTFNSADSLPGTLRRASDWDRTGFSAYARFLFNPDGTTQVVTGSPFAAYTVSSAGTQTAVQTSNDLNDIYGSFTRQADGKWLAVARSSTSNPSATVLRFNADLSLDTSWGNTGIATIEPATASTRSAFNALALGPDGSILAAGYREELASLPSAKFLAYRLWRDNGPVGLVDSPALNSAGVNPYRFSVTWRSDAAIDLASLGDDDLQIIGPNGEALKARKLGMSATGDPRQVIVSYKVAAPAGGWSFLNNGSWAIRVRTGIRDSQGDVSHKRTLGSFQVAI